jgi:hypothetical protein
MARDRQTIRIFSLCLIRRNGVSISLDGFLLMSSGDVDSDPEVGMGMMMLTLRQPEPSSSPSPSNLYVRDFPSSPKSRVRVRVALNVFDEVSPNMLMLDSREGGERSADAPW